MLKGEPKPNGRKYTLTKVGLAMTGAPLLGVYLLAALGKMNSDVATVTTVYFGAVAGLVGAFQAANAYTTGKAADAGILERSGGP